MKKYVVICYAIHEKEIAQSNVFSSYEEAVEFLTKDAQNTYNEEVTNSSKNANIELDLDEDRALLSAHNNEYTWTWEIVEIKMQDKVL